MTEFDIERFTEAQESGYCGYAQALSEITAGQKHGHWIWYIFPQLRGLGYSTNAQFYGIENLQEAQAYLLHPVLGVRLREITQAALDHADDRIAVELMGAEIDALKLKSSMTLFDRVCPRDIFADVLDAFFDGERCLRTLNLLK